MICPKYNYNCNKILIIINFCSSIKIYLWDFNIYYYFSLYLPTIPLIPLWLYRGWKGPLSAYTPTVIIESIRRLVMKVHTGYVSRRFSHSRLKFVIQYNYIPIPGGNDVSAKIVKPRKNYTNMNWRESFRYPAKLLRSLYKIY